MRLKRQSALASREPLWSVSPYIRTHETHALKEAVGACLAFRLLVHFRRRGLFALELFEAFLYSFKFRSLSLCINLYRLSR